MQSRSQIVWDLGSGPNGSIHTYTADMGHFHTLCVRTAERDTTLQSFDIKSINEALKARFENVIEEEGVIFTGSDVVRAVVHL